MAVECVRLEADEGREQTGMLATHLPDHVDDAGARVPPPRHSDRRKIATHTLIDLRLAVEPRRLFGDQLLGLLVDGVLLGVCGDLPADQGDCGQRHRSHREQLERQPNAQR